MLNMVFPKAAALGHVSALPVSTLQNCREDLQTVHGYADDTQLYLSFCPDSSVAQDRAVLATEALISEVRSLLISLKLKLNDI